MSPFILSLRSPCSPSFPSHRHSPEGLDHSHRSTHTHTHTPHTQASPIRRTSLSSRFFQHPPLLLGVLQQFKKFSRHSRRKLFHQGSRAFFQFLKELRQFMWSVFIKYCRHPTAIHLHPSQRTVFLPFRTPTKPENRALVRRSLSFHLVGRLLESYSDSVFLDTY